MSLHDQIVQALCTNLKNGAGKPPDRPEYETTYYAEHKDNLLDSISPEAWTAIQGELDRGLEGPLNSRKRHKSGKRSPPKFDAIHSSSALVVNTFGKWKLDPKTLTLCGNTDFTTLNFAKEFKTGFPGAPNLDVYLENETTVIAVESKFLDFLPRSDTSEPKAQKIPPAYHRERFEEHWWKAVEFLRANPFMHCPVAQLIKHYYGLRCLTKLEQEERLKGHKVILLYLYWTPANAADFEIFQEHDQELRAFSDIVNTENATIQFQSMSYPELWQAWEKTDCRQHAEQLRRRYEVTLTR